MNSLLSKLETQILAFRFSLEKENLDGEIVFLIEDMLEDIIRLSLKGEWEFVLCISGYIKRICSEQNIARFTPIHLLIRKIHDKIRLLTN